MENNLTPFELQLKQYFPEIFNLHLLSKDQALGGGGEQYIWTVAQALIEANQTGMTGDIKIHINQGHIDGIEVTNKLLSHRGRRSGEGYTTR